MSSRGRAAAPLIAILPWRMYQATSFRAATRLRRLVEQADTPDLRETARRDLSASSSSTLDYARRSNVASLAAGRNNSDVLSTCWPTHVELNPLSAWIETTVSAFTHQPTQADLRETCDAPLVRIRRFVGHLDEGQGTRHFQQSRRRRSSLEPGRSSPAAGQAHRRRCVDRSSLGGGRGDASVYSPKDHRSPKTINDRLLRGFVLGNGDTLHAPDIGTAHARS